MSILTCKTMQTINSTCMNFVTLNLFVALLFLIFSCSSNAEKQSQSTIATPETDLHTTTISGDLAAVKQHIQAGSDLNERDPFGGSSPLITAAVFGKPEIAKVLIEAGADINFQNNEQSTPLITA